MTHDDSTTEQYFKAFRENTIGYGQYFATPYGRQRMIYADWVASGRLYGPIEELIAHKIGPYVGNTHTETSETGTLMTKAYHYAKDIIRKHVNASQDDVVLTTGFGMTGAINKFQRILGFKGCGLIHRGRCIHEGEKPVVFVTHMEHHSNQTSWYETAAEVVIIPPDDKGLPSEENLRQTLKKYRHRKRLIASITACSNVTGIETDYHRMARTIHEYGGLCFVDFAANAPYSAIDMHPADEAEKLDAIFFSPHKFLGGPGSSGVLIFDKKLYDNPIPDHPGGGTVDWTNAWGEHKYVDDIEAREDGGTPGFLQAMRTALAIKLKEQMDVDMIHRRERELSQKVFEGFAGIDGLHILAENIKERIGAISFYFDDIHYNLVVKLLNDRFGVQVRGGCACAGTYGHILFGIDQKESHRISAMINRGDLSKKPGFVRLSIHPTMSNEEVEFIIDALAQIRQNHREWAGDYHYDKSTNEFYHKNTDKHLAERYKQWFEL